MLEIKEFKFYHIETGSITTVNLSTESFRVNVFPILWGIDGLYFLVPVEIIENALESVKDLKNTQEDLIGLININIAQAIEIPIGVAKFLLKEKIRERGLSKLIEATLEVLPEQQFDVTEFHSHDEESTSNECKDSSDKSTDSDSPG
jgi:hypothetical protein